MSLEAWGDGGEETYYTSEEASAQADEAFVTGLQAMREMLPGSWSKAETPSRPTRSG